MDVDLIIILIFQNHVHESYEMFDVVICLSHLAGI